MRIAAPVFSGLLLLAADPATADEATNVRIHNAKASALVFLQETKDCAVAGQSITRHVVPGKGTVELACRIDAALRDKTAKFLIYNDRKGRWKGQCEFSIWREGPASVEGRDVYTHNVEARSIGAIDCRELRLGEDRFRLDVQ